MKKFLAGFLMGDCAPLNMFLRPAVLLGFRLYIANVFWKSGMNKIGNMDTTIMLFKEEYKVPFLPPEFAAYLATGAELIIPVMLVIGFFTRPAALALFILNVVAMMTLAGNELFASPIGNLYHILWGVMIGVIFTFGPGALSVDKLLSNRWKNG